VSIYEYLCQRHYMKKQSVTFWLASLVVILLFGGCSHSGSVARTTPATESIKGQYIATSQLVDAGNTTPEAALESFYWALFDGNYDAYIACYVPQARKEMAQVCGGDKTKFATQMQKRYAFVNGVQILARKIVANDKAELKYRLEFKPQGPRRADAATKIAILVKVGSAWESPGENNAKKYETNWDEGSQPESEP
jgi:hypothetical protein